jgi:lysophospholipase L1-like esterase
VVCIGDSITAYEPGFVSALQARYPRWTFVNAGCGMTTSWQWSLWEPAPGFQCTVGAEESLFSILVQPHLPCDLAYVMFGANDTRAHAAVLEDRESDLWLPVPPESYTSAILTICERLLTQGCKKVVLLGCPDFASQWHHLVEERNRMTSYRMRLHDIADFTPDVEVGPDMSLVLTHDENYTFDGIHISPLGYTRITAVLDEDLQRRLGGF